jgi:G:T/U-mismatch repair DNA glycosylase
MYSKHPFEPFVPANATKLIIGTIPPARFCYNQDSKKEELEDGDVEFYYGSRDNYFWELIGTACNKDFKSGSEGVDHRKQFLTENKIGITDVIETCERPLNKSASDKDLTSISYKDLKTLLNENPAIDTLIYTSEYVKALINKMFQESKAYHSIDPVDKKKQSVILNAKKYNVWVLYSPSPQALINMGTNGAEKRLEQYKEVFTCKKN